MITGITPYRMTCGTDPIVTLAHHLGLGMPHTECRIDGGETSGNRYFKSA